MSKHARSVVVMGVSGSGKTTVARALAEAKGWCALDADDFHSIEAKARMAAGQPLTDSIREPWVAALAAELASRNAAGQDVVLACSGLRRAHRDRLRASGVPLQFLFLRGSRELIAARLHRRDGHFMPPALLESQFADLQDPCGEKDVSTIGIDGEPAQVVARALAAVA